MTTNVKTTLQVAFGSNSSNDHLSVEVDSRADGLNAGKTSFLPGDTAYILIHKSWNMVIDQIIVSAGTVIDATAGVIVREEELSFAESSSAALSVPSTGLVSVQWLGHSLGTLTLQPDGMTVKADTSGVAMARVRYNVEPIAKGIKSPAYVQDSIVDFSINLLIKATVI